MAKKENLGGLTDEDLRKKLEELVKGLMNLRFRKVTEGVENSAQFRKALRRCRGMNCPDPSITTCERSSVVSGGGLGKIPLTPITSHGKRHL